MSCTYNLMAFSSLLLHFLFCHLVFSRATPLNLENHVSLSLRLLQVIYTGFFNAVFYPNCAPHISTSIPLRRNKLPWGQWNLIPSCCFLGWDVFMHLSRFHINQQFSGPFFSCFTGKFFKAVWSGHSSAYLRLIRI